MWYFSWHIYNFKYRLIQLYFGFCCTHMSSKYTTTLLILLKKRCHCLLKVFWKNQDYKWSCECTQLWQVFIKRNLVKSILARLVQNVLFERILTSAPMSILNYLRTIYFKYHCLIAGFDPVNNINYRSYLFIIVHSNCTSYILNTLDLHTLAKRLGFIFNRWYCKQGKVFIMKVLTS